MKVSQQDQSASVAWRPPTWEEAVQTQFDRVFRLAYRLSGNRQDAEDITQEVFLKVFRSLSTLKPGSIEGWLHRITTNVFLDQVRRQKRIRMDPMGQTDTGFADRSELTNPQRHFEYQNLSSDVQAALNELKIQYRVVVVLCDIEGLSYEEIAQTLGIKLGTVRSRIHRARAKLRVSLAHLEPPRPNAQTVAPPPPALAGLGDQS